ncbi:MAG: magnesium transporter [Rubrivivax sp.]|nr:magnesium transporter [Rubrivivax sp.]
MSNARAIGTETSGGLAVMPALSAAADETAGACRERVQAGAHRDWDLLCVLGDGRRLVGTLRPQELLALPDAVPLGEAAHLDATVVGPDVDQELIASLAITQGVVAVPVVDAQRRLLGVIGPAALMDILRREHVEDLHRLAGILRETDQARDALESPPLRRARHRLPWLMVGLLGCIVATAIVARFEEALAAQPALAFFIPALVYLADAIGTQSEAVAVRGLSLSRIGIARLVGSEMRTGAVIGTALALVTLPLVWIAFGDPALAVTVSLALAGSSLVASSLGLALPWLLDRLGSDPAYGSGPLATIAQDVLTLLIYFGCATVILL